MSDSCLVDVGDDVVATAPRGSVYHIPRPSLIGSDRSSAVGSTPRGSASSQGSSSTTSTQSGASGSLLLTAANLAQLAAAYPPGRHRAHTDDDAASLASSEHFTVVHGLERRGGKPLPECCCRHRQLPVLVLAMSVIFLVALLVAVLFMEMRWRDIRMFT